MKQNLVLIRTLTLAYNLDNTPNNPKSPYFVYTS